MIRAKIHSRSFSPTGLCLLCDVSCSPRRNRADLPNNNTISFIIHKRSCFFHMVIHQKIPFFPCTFHMVDSNFRQICPFFIKTNRKFAKSLSKLPKNGRCGFLRQRPFFSQCQITLRHAHVVLIPPDYFTAIASISRRTSFGSLATSTQERAGQSFAKYFA